MNQPQTYEAPLAHRLGASMATQEYCPPATGYALHISAMEYATVRAKRQTATHPQIITGGPPDSTPMVRTPLNAVQEVTILNEKPIIPNKLKLLPLYFPSKNAKFITINKPTSSWAADAYIPWALPTSFDWRPGPVVNGSSTMATSPNPVGEVLLMGASATFTAVALRPLTMSWK